MTRTPPRYTIMLGAGQHNAWRLLPRGQRHLESFDHYSNRSPYWRRWPPAPAG